MARGGEAGGIRRAHFVNPYVRPEPPQGRWGVGLCRAFEGHCPVDIAYRVQQIKPFRQREPGRLAREPLHRRVRPHRHGHLAKPRRLFQKAEVARANVLEGAGDNNLSGMQRDWAHAWEWSVERGEVNR